MEVAVFGLGFDKATRRGEVGGVWDEVNVNIPIHR